MYFTVDAFKQLIIVMCINLLLINFLYIYKITIYVYVVSFNLDFVLNSLTFKSSLKYVCLIIRIFT